VLLMEGVALLVAIGVTAIAGLVRGFTGFGGALVMTPVLLSWLDPISTTALVILVNVVAGVWQASELYRESDRVLVGWLSLVGISCAPVGVWAIQIVPVQQIQQVVGIVVLLVTAALTTGWRMPLSIRTPWGRTVLGGLSGFFFGMGGIGGPPVVLGLLAERMPPRRIRATQLSYFTLIQIFILGVFMIQGFMSLEIWLLGAGLALVYTLTGILGGRLLTDTREGLFRGASITVLCAVGLYALIGG
jgi:uncharacterized membrane protein YfcA